MTVAGLVLVRQRPGTATGIIFMTIEDETGIANIVVWSSPFERQRRIVLSASMVGCRGHVQREGDVIHLVAERLEDLTPLLRSVGERDEAFPAPHGRGDEIRHDGAPDPHALGRKVHGAHTPNVRTGALSVKTRDFH